jgi:cellulose synthase/poly-beta-1,6-N-acetylglucosamine synthase-like glycosyltransferase
MKPKLNVSVGIFVYNEEKNISNILSALSKQVNYKTNILEIIVVSSGSTDRTNDLVISFAKKNKKIKLIIQETREGKASAINLFLKKMKGEIGVIESGDTIPEKDTIEELCSPFSTDEKIGLTGARSIPTNNKNTFLGYLIHYWWWISNELPRFGEMIAFRRVLVSEISNTTAVDEAYIEAMIANQKYSAKQVSSAVIHNHGAENIKDLIKQRKRVYVGHKLLEHEKNYSVQSFNFLRILKLTLKYLKKEKSVKGIFYLFGGALIEVYSRILGMYDLYIKKKNPYIWDISTTTKKLK